MACLCMPFMQHVVSPLDVYCSARQLSRLCKQVAPARFGSLPAADIVEIKHIMLPPSAREFKDIYVVFELMETDLHQVSAILCAMHAEQLVNLHQIPALAAASCLLH